MAYMSQGAEIAETTRKLTKLLKLQNRAKLVQCIPAFLECMCISFFLPHGTSYVPRCPNGDSDLWSFTRKITSYQLI
jgi:hypothetical protein